VVIERDNDRALWGKAVFTPILKILLETEHTVSCPLQPCHLACKAADRNEAALRGLAF
jgi:hypothetical protein